MLVSSQQALNSISNINGNVTLPIYSPTFLAYPHVCILLNTVILHSDVVESAVMHFVTVAILKKLHPDMFLL